MLKIVAGFLTVLVIIALVEIGFYFGSKSKIPVPQMITQPFAQKTPSSTPSATLELINDDNPTTVFVNPSTTISAIKEVFNRGSYSRLAPYTADKVMLLISATECCGPVTRKDAIKQTEDYLAGATQPWETSEDSQIAKMLAQKNPENFKDAIIVTSSNKYAAGFSLDDEYLINKIILVSNYKLITQ